MIRMGKLGPQLDAFIARVRGTVDSLAGARDVVIEPVPDERPDGLTNTAVIARLSRHSPALVAPAADMDREARALARQYWRPWETSLAEIAVVAGIGAARAIAARLRSGDFVTNTEATLAKKSREGRGTTPGIDTGNLAASLDAASARIVE